VPLAAAGQAGLHGLGTPAAVLLLVPMEAGLPIPIPSDLVMLVIGEQVAAGALPLWAAVVAFEVVAVVGTTLLFVACRGPGHALVARIGPRIGLTEERLARATSLLARKGRPALAVGRSTPGLRTVTVVAAGGSGMSLRGTLPALVLGSSVFLQLHLFFGILRRLRRPPRPGPGPGPGPGCARLVGGGWDRVLACAPRPAGWRSGLR
jgi:membrane protein DedA with SNARE-associated domain